MTYKFNNKLSPKRIVIITVLAISSVLITVGIFVMFPHLMNRERLIQIQYLEMNNQPRVISLYEEIASNDDGSHLTGYWLYLSDPIENKELNKLFIKRNDKNNDLPTAPDLIINDKEELWLIGAKGLFQGDQGFVRLLKITNTELTIQSTDFLKDWSISSNYIYNHQLSLVNQYNEPACLDINTHQVSEPCSFQEDSLTQSNSCFFFVKTTQSSTRGHVYYYQTSRTPKQPDIFVGTTQEGEVTPGWQLTDVINMQRNFITQADLDAYEANFDTSDHLSKIYNTDFINNPMIIFQDKEVCVLSGSDDRNAGCTFYLFHHSGRLVWKVTCPQLRKQTFAYNFTSIYNAKETIITHPQNWVISIDNKTGKILWQYPR